MGFARSDAAQSASVICEVVTVTTPVELCLLHRHAGYWRVHHFLSNFGSRSLMSDKGKQKQLLIYGSLQSFAVPPPPPKDKLCN